jgi:outer membrane protein insertion porin family
MMTPPSRLRLCLISAVSCLCSIATPLRAQKSSEKAPAQARQLIAITVTGSTRFPEAAIAAASGLQVGTSVVEDDFKKAARRLGDTGAFADVGYKFSYSSEGTKLEFQVVDAPKFAPVRFEDFVWFSDADMLKRIKESAPLFDGTVPLSGRLADQVSDVLQAMLVENGIPGHVEYTRAPAAQGLPESVVYQVSDVLITVRNIEFTGLGEAELQPLEEAANRISERAYSRLRLQALVQHQLLPVLHARGFLKAAFGDSQPKVIRLAPTDTDSGPRNQTIVDVTFAVTPGQQYKLKALEWSGNHEFSSDVLQKMVLAKPGEPANTVRLADNLKDIQKLYGSHGFVTATIKADAHYDDAAGTVVIVLDVKEGLEYHMGELEFRGLDNSLTAKLRNAWKLRPGDVYDASYLSDYLPQAQKLLPSSLDWDVASHVTANVREKTVDVDIIYTVKAPK